MINSTTYVIKERRCVNSTRNDADPVVTNMVIDRFWPVEDDEVLLFVARRFPRDGALLYIHKKVVQVDADAFDFYKSAIAEAADFVHAVTTLSNGVNHMSQLESRLRGILK